MNVSIPPRFGVSPAAAAVMLAMQRTAPKPAAANPDVLIMSSLRLLLGWIAQPSSRSFNLLPLLVLILHLCAVGQGSLRRASLRPMIAGRPAALGYPDAALAAAKLGDANRSRSI